ncbi:MAG: ShlB/FhaC/HecB family hemolysin secretion/activation protein, partial [Moraxellaceae bacterium]
DIPSVKERDPNPEGGQRLNVKEFRIQGLEDDPEFNISKAELIKRVEAIRFDLMGEGEKTKSGYTLKELAEMADLIAQIEEESADQHVGPVEVQKLVFLIREQRRRRGITLGMIETVADTITQYYRERGFILAKAYIPQQQVRDGVVSLNIMLGKLGGVEVVNSKRINKSLLKRTFNGSLDQPVTAQNTEENLYLINDIPGVYAQGYFEPGDQVGDTRLKLNVTKEAWFDTSVRMDNHGAKTTGENRIYGEFVLHNPSTLGDEIQLSALRTEEDSSYGALHYSLPIYTPRLRMKIGVSQNDFVSRINFDTSSAAGVEYSGSAKVMDAEISYHLARGRKHNSALSLQFNSIKTNIDLNQDEKIPVVDTKLDNLSLNYHTDYLNEKSRSLHQLDIGITSAKETDANSANNANGEGALLRDMNTGFFYYNYSLLSFFKNPIGQSDLRLVVNHSLQYAGKALSSSNKFDLSGPNRARAFDLNHFVADDAAHVAADIIFNTPK